MPHPHRLVVLTLGLVLAGGCDDATQPPGPVEGPPPEAATATNAPEAPPADGSADGPPAEGTPVADATGDDPHAATVQAINPGPEDAAEGPELGDRPDRIPAADELPTFENGDVKLTIALPATITGQVDFFARDPAAPTGYRVVHAQRFEDTDQVVVMADSKVSGDLYVLVHQFPDGRPTYGPDVIKGVVVDPVQLSGGAQQLQVVMNEGTAWMAEVFKPGPDDPVVQPDPDKQQKSD